MQVGTGKSILNGIAIGKLKIYKKKDTVISTAQVADTAAEEARLKRPGPRPLTSRLPCMKGTGRGRRGHCRGVQHPCHDAG